MTLFYLSVTFVHLYVSKFNVSFGMIKQLNYKSVERLKSSFRTFYGRYGDLIQQYEVSLSRMLNDILIIDQQWLPNQSDFPLISWPWYRAWPSPIMSGFHGTFATGVACQQGTLTLPDTWFRPPLWDLLMLQLLRPDSSNLQYSLLHFLPQIPLVLSLFCYTISEVSKVSSYPWPDLFPLASRRGIDWSRGNRFLPTLSMVYLNYILP